MQVQPDSFEHFARLVRNLGRTRAESSIQPRARFAQFLHALPCPLPPRYGTHLFRLLFPHIMPRRRYQMKETVLARRLCDVMRLNVLQAGSLYGWNEGVGGRGTSGCLGEEVERVARHILEIRSTGKVATLSLAEIDRLLDELASHSPFSQLGKGHVAEPRSQTDILYDLFVRSNLSPFACSVLVQIILSDLRPLLSPLPPEALSFTTALLVENKAAPQLDITAALEIWDWEARPLYRVWSNLDVVLDEIERRGGGAGKRRRPDRGVTTDLDELVRPGINIEIPKCEKGRSIRSALKMIAGPSGERTKTIWAETKYDGIRVQIHVWIDRGGQRQVRLFSKSKRDSTLDRRACHTIILASLGHELETELPQHAALAERLTPTTKRLTPTTKRLTPTTNKPIPIHSIIMEAELLPYNEHCRGNGRGPGIEEFWHLSRIRSDDKRSHRHYYLAFFDILYLNGLSLLRRSYNTRRRYLEQYLQVIPGYCQIAERYPIDISRGLEFAEQRLASIFAASKARIEEGLVLKAAESQYNDMRLRWVKLKRDYIPGMGDCLDLAVIGMGWDRDRARELRVGTSVMTTLYAAVLTNPQEVLARKQVAHFEVLFTVSYGLTRDQLERINRNVELGKIPSRIWKRDEKGIPGMSYQLTLRGDCLLPSVVFNEPLNVELMGAGFQKLPGSKYHALRWPRVQKVHLDRCWTEALSGPEYLAESLKALGQFNGGTANLRSEGQGVLEASLTNLVRANHLSGTDIVDLSPVKVRNPIRIKSESPSERSSLRATKSLPDARRQLYPSCDHNNAYKRARSSDATRPSERILKIRRRTSYPHVHG